MVVMIIQSARMGVQYADGAGLALQLRIVPGEGFEGLPTATDHQVIECALMLPSQRTQFFGQGEAQQKILGRHLFFDLPFQPLLAFMMLAMGTVAMAAGMRDEDLFFAAVALRPHHLSFGWYGTVSGRPRLCADWATARSDKPPGIRLQRFG